MNGKIIQIKTLREKSSSGKGSNSMRRSRKLYLSETMKVTLLLSR